MDSLVIKGQQKVMGINIPVMEGGFGEGQKVILVKNISELHNNRIDKINDLIKNNITKFNENELIDLKPLEGFRDFIKENKLLTSNRTKNIFLLSQRGYIKLVSMMDNDNDKKWDVMNNLIDDYFNMKAELKGGQPKSSLDLLELQVKALKEVEQKVENVDKKFDELPLFTADAKALKKLVNRVVVPLLGGKKSNAYKPLSKKVFSDLYGQVHREFGVDCCDAIKRKDLEFAREFISDYRLPTALKNEIDILNNQSKLEV